MIIEYHKARSIIKLISVYLGDSSKPTQFFPKSDWVTLNQISYDPLKVMAISFTSVNSEWGLLQLSSIYEALCPRKLS